MKTITSLLAAFAIVACATESYAQGNASPIEPNTVRKSRYGIFAGIPLVVQHGSYDPTTCNCPAFEDGRGGGVIIGGLYEPETSSKFILGFTAGYDYRYVDASYSFLDTVDYRNEGGRVFDNVPTLYRHTSSLGFGTGFVGAYLKLYVSSRFFVRAGAQAGLAFYSYIHHEQQLLSDIIQFPNGESVTPSAQDREIKVLEDGKYPYLSTFQAAINPAIGYELKAGKKWSFMPVVQYSIPLTGYSTVNKDLRFSAWQFMVELHYNLEIVE